MFVIAPEEPPLFRAGKIWHLKAPCAFWLCPAARSQPLSEAELEQLLQAAAADRPRELIAGGWLVRAVGEAWKRPALVAQLRRALLDGPAALAASMQPARQKARLTQRLANAWAALQGRIP